MNEKRVLTHLGVKADPETSIDGSLTVAGREMTEAKREMNTVLAKSQKSKAKKQEGGKKSGKAKKGQKEVADGSDQRTEEAGMSLAEQHVACLDPPEKAQVDHHHLVQLHQLNETEDMMAIVYRRYQGGDLEGRRKKHWKKTVAEAHVTRTQSDSSITAKTADVSVDAGGGIGRATSNKYSWELRVRKWLLQVAAALQYMHTHPAGRVIHNDVKLENVLLDANDDAFLADFDRVR